MKKLRITVEGKTYDVLVEVLDEPTAPAAAPAVARPVSSASVAPVASAAPAPRAAAGSGDIPSPLAGKVVSIDVKIGDSVDEGAQVATIEAMKMNTYIYAPRAGKVAAINVKAGDGVEEGASLLTLG